MAAKDVELTLKGYNRKAVPEGNWKVLSGDKKTVAIAQWVEWVFEGGKEKVYGFFLKDKDDDVLWKETFEDGPYEILRKGDKLRIRPKMSFGEEG
jgi:phage terminase large subunit-like protein